jgi:hypothetical protein
MCSPPDPPAEFQAFTGFINNWRLPRKIGESNQVLEKKIFCVPEILEYAEKIGIDIKSEPHLLYLAKEGVLQELPPQWKPW